MRRTAAFAILFLLAAAAQAIEAQRLGAHEKIVLDGRFDEPAWGRARPWDRFYEMSPQDKIEAKVRTEVRFAYDGHALYAAVRNHDPNPGELRAPFARRDNVFADQDMVVLSSTRSATASSRISCVPTRPG